MLNISENVVEKVTALTLCSLTLPENHAFFSIRWTGQRRQYGACACMLDKMPQTHTRTQNM